MSNCEQLKIYTDAAYQANGASGIAAVLVNEAAKPIYVTGKRVAAQSNTEAELKAVLYALNEIPCEGQNILILCDNTTVVNLLNGSTENAAVWLNKFANRINDYITEQNLKVTYQWVSRDNNHVADAAAVLAARNGSVWICDL